MKKALLLPVAALAAALVFVGCGGGGASGTQTTGVTSATSGGSSTTGGTTQLKPNVKVLPQGAVTSSTSNQVVLTVTDPSLQINAGDVLLSREGRGLLRKASTVTRGRAPGELIVTTTQASLDDTLAVADASLQTSLDYSQWTFTPSVPGISMISSGRGRAINVPLFKFDNVALADNVTASGSIGMDVDVDFAFKYGITGLKTFRCVPKVGAEGSLEIMAGVNAQISKEIKLGTAVGPSFLVAGIPCTPVLDIYSDISGSVQAGFDISASASTSVAAGVTYDGSAWAAQSDFNPSVTLTGGTRPVAAVTFSATPIRAVLTMKIADVAGPYVSVEAPKLDGTVDFVGNCAHLKADATIGASAGVSVSILGHQLLDKSFPDFLSHEWSLVDTDFACVDTNGGGDGGTTTGTTGGPENLTISESTVVAAGQVGFCPQGPSQYWHDATLSPHDGLTLGDGGHMLWTYADSEAEGVSNTGDWRPLIGTTANYDVQVFIPRWYGDTSDARYQINAADGLHVVHVAQINYNDGWADLGIYPFNAGTSGFLRLQDVTSDPQGPIGGTSRTRRWIAFDTAKWIRQ